MGRPVSDPTPPGQRPGPDTLFLAYSMSFLENIFAGLQRTDRPVLREIGDGRTISVTGRELLELVGKARGFLSTRGLKKGDRCALVAHNSIRWVAMDLAMMAEGLIVAPLYARQAPVELVAMMKDSSPSLICCGDDSLRRGIIEPWPEAQNQYLFEQIFTAQTETTATVQLADSDPITIIYTSGSGGEGKGVVLNAGNISHMLGCTSRRLDLLGGEKQGQDRVFHYLPFCFAGSWIMLLTCLLRGSLLTLNTDLSKLAAITSSMSLPCWSECAKPSTSNSGKPAAWSWRSIAAPKLLGLASTSIGQAGWIPSGWAWRIQRSFPRSARR